MENNLKDQHYKNMGIMPQMDTLTFEAESVAYAVCRHYGIDTSEYSFGYIAGWSSDRKMDELKESMDTIRRTTTKIISKVDGYMNEKNYRNNKLAEIEKQILEEKSCVRHYAR